jgi:peptide/nickel transport system substrate-binding protein
MSYWSEILNQRISRRRGIAAVGGVSAAAAFLAACGGSDSGGSQGGTSDKSGLITKAVDTTKQAKRGGTLKWFAPNEPAHLDVQLDQVAMNQHKNLVYGHYVNEKAGVLKPAAYEEYAPEMMESWEFSPDRLQLTFKLRQGVKWHNKAPVNGRVLDTEDVIFSWNRHAAKGTDRSFLSNAANPNAPVLSVTSPDSRTIVYKLKEPVVFMLAALTPTQTGKPNIIPKETDSTFDIRQDMIGTGPFMLSKYTPTVGFTYKRNPDYWDKDWPLVDEIEVPVVLQYPQALAQVRAGSIHSYAYSSTNTVRAEDIVPLKKDIPDILVYSSEPTATTVRSLVFGWPPTEANKPFKDERVRQAISMTWDRDAYISAFNNADKFQAEGLPVNTYWNTALPPAYGRWFLDPKGKDFGPNAKYFQRDVAEAKKLLAAAGYPNGVEVTSSYIGGPQLGADFQRQVGVTDEFAKEAGFRVKVNTIDYASQYVGQYRDGNGKYDGWLYRAGGSPATDATAYFSTLFHSKYGGPGFLGFDASGKGDGSGDPTLEGMLNKARIEPDLEKRRSIIYDMQRYLAKTMYAIPHPPGDASFFFTAWAAVQNFLVYQGDRRGSVSAVHTWWLDETKPPLKRA